MRPEPASRMKVIEARRRGRVVEGTPLLREHLGKTWIKGSNPFVSANANLYGPKT